MSFENQISLDRTSAESALINMLTKVKSSSQTRRSNSTLSADSELKFLMLKNASYVFRLVVFFDSDPAADFKWRHVGPSSPTSVRIRRQNIGCGDTAPSDVAVDTAYSSVDVSVACAAATGGWVEMEGVIVNGSTQGYFEFHWSQETSDASDTKVLQGSFIQYKRIDI